LRGRPSRPPSSAGRAPRSRCATAPASSRRPGWPTTEPPARACYSVAAARTAQPLTTSWPGAPRFTPQDGRGLCRCLYSGVERNWFSAPAREGPNGSRPSRASTPPFPQIGTIFPERLKHTIDMVAASPGAGRDLPCRLPAAACGIAAAVTAVRRCRSPATPRAPLNFVLPCDVRRDSRTSSRTHVKSRPDSRHRIRCARRCYQRRRDRELAGRAG
jgi:hypothetical protein